MSVAEVSVRSSFLSLVDYHVVSSPNEKMKTKLLRPVTCLDL